MNNQKDPKIANRESWLKVFVIGGFSALIAWKLLAAPIAFNLADFKFTDLLNLLLAFFAIALSVAFYFKATDTSNQFYDNTYKFTKEFSEILGRIEAGFGERLRHLDEGYSGLRERFDKIPFDSKKAETEIREEQKEVEKKEEERNRLLENLAERAKLQDREKHELFKQLKEKDEELLKARRELSFLQNRLERAQTDDAIVSDIPKEVLSYFSGFFVGRLGREAATLAPRGYLQRQFSELKPQIGGIFLRSFRKYNLTDDEDNLTEKGFKLIRYIGQNFPLG